jgi:hypothetical protein
MEVFELRYPGTWIENVQYEQNVQILLSHLESQLADASIGLALFTEALSAMPLRASERMPGPMRRQARSRVIAEAMERQLANNLDPAERFKATDAIRDAADLQVRREEWAAGRLPDSYERRFPFIYAHAVVYALDAIGKTLKGLTSMGLPTGVTDAWNAYKSALPRLVDVRDSAHHIEDRARGLDRRGNPLVLHPVNNGMVSAPNGALILSQLSGNMLGYTASDGHFREVEISTASVAAAQSAIQQVLDALTWRGPARTVPS